MKTNLKLALTSYILLLLAVLISTVTALAQGTKSAAAPSAENKTAPQAQPSQQLPPTIASTVDRQITTIEK